MKRIGLNPPRSSCTRGQKLKGVESMAIKRTAAGDAAMRDNNWAVSVPGRRILGAIHEGCYLRDLARTVRLGELERHLDELMRRGLIEIVEGRPSQLLPDGGAVEQTTAPLFAQLGIEELAQVKVRAAQFFNEYVPEQAQALNDELSAVSDETDLLIELGLVRRFLFDVGGQACANRFFEEVVAPAYYPIPAG
jgi:hypothetical protein